MTIKKKKNRILDRPGELGFSRLYFLVRYRPGRENTPVEQPLKYKERTITVSKPH